MNNTDFIITFDKVVVSIVDTINKKGYSIDLYPDNIIHLKFDGKEKITLEKMIEVKNVGLEFLKYQKFKSIVDFRGVSGILSEKAKKYVANDPEFNHYKICDAILTNSYTTSFLIGIYLQFFKPKSLTKAFSNFDDAFEWASKQKES